MTPKEYQRQYEQRPEVKARRAAHRAANRELLNEKLREWRRLNPEKQRALTLKHAATRRLNGKASASNARWYYNNHERLKAKHREWRRNNKELYLSHRRNREQASPSFKIGNHLRTRIRMALKRKTNKRDWRDVLGCPIHVLKQWIESQWDSEMSWENHSKYGWHIDHVRPCSSFDLTDPAQLKECFHYTNTQPLWWDENGEKAASWEGKPSKRAQLVSV